MKKKTFVCILIISILGFIGCGSKQEIPAYDYDGDELYKLWPFPVGVAVPGARTGSGSAILPSSPQYPLLKHFNVVVAENEMKPDAIMGSSKGGAYNWTNADALVNFAEEKGKRVRGHVLIWHDQTPAWFFQGSGVSGRATKAELYANMENHIKAVFQKYGGRIDTWDVCNEVVDHTITTNGGAREDSNYTKIMQDSGLTGIDRYEYVVKAFEWARKYADENNGQNVKLYLTDYGIERRFPGTTRSKVDVFKELVQYLIDNDAPIDGIGFQGHFRLYDHPPSEVAEWIDIFSAMEKKDGAKLKVQVCELDISIYSNAKNEGSLTNLSGSTLSERLSDLADTYRDFFDMFEEKYNDGKLDMALIWGIADGHSWLNNHPVPNRTDYPLLFDRNYKPKEAFIKLTENRE
jgi:endo-1,4-beta-xylanase